MQRSLRWLILLLGGVVGLLSCAPLPEQPNHAQPYALLAFPEEIRLVALDTQSIDPRARIKGSWVTPGPHRLRLTYAGRSLQRMSQQIDPICLETQAGHEYLFGTRTLGSSGRPIIETTHLIPGYCEQASDLRGRDICTTTAVWRRKLLGASPLRYELPR